MDAQQSARNVRLQPHQVDPRVAEFKTEFGIPLIREDTLERRDDQWPLIKEVLRCDQSCGVIADTSLGKTVIFITKLAQALAQGKRVVVTAVTRPLVQQIAREILKFTYLEEDDVAVLTGQKNARSRARMHQTRPRVIVATKEVIRNDIQSGSFIWDGVGLFIFDEFHLAQGNDAYVELMHAVVEAGVQRLACSATLARDDSKLLLLRTEAKLEKLFVLDTTSDKLMMRDVYVPLDDELNEGVTILREAILRLYASIKWSATAHKVMPLFDREDIELEHPLNQELPVYEQRRKLRERIGRLEEEHPGKFFALQTKWSELALLCWLHDALGCLGRYSFLEEFSYRYARRRFCPEGFIVPELDNSTNRGERRFEAILTSTPRLWALFARLAKGTPYEALVECASWSEVFASTYPELLRGLDRELPDWTPTEQLRAPVLGFFNNARSELAAREEGFDHRKLAALLAGLSQHPPTEDNAKTIVFTWTRRHVGFLGSWLGQRTSRIGFVPTMAVGPRSAKETAYVDESLDRFRSGAANLLVTTDFLRLGIDVPRAKYCYEFCTPDTEPIKKKQGRGRVGRGNDDEPAFLSNLLTPEVNEPKRMMISRWRIKHMQRASRARGKLVSGSKDDP